MKMEEREQRAREIAEKYEFEYEDVFRLLECVGPMRTIILLKKKMVKERKEEKRRKWLEQKDEERKFIEEKWWAQDLKTYEERRDYINSSLITNDDFITKVELTALALYLLLTWVASLLRGGFKFTLTFCALAIFIVISASLGLIMVLDSHMPNWRYEQRLKCRWLNFFFDPNLVIDPKKRATVNQILLERFSPRKVKRIWKKKERILLKNEKVERRKAAKEKKAEAKSNARKAKFDTKLIATVAKEERKKAIRAIADENRKALMRKYYGAHGDIYLAKVECLIDSRIELVISIMVPICFGVWVSLMAIMSHWHWLLAALLAIIIILEVVCACVARAIILNNEKVFEVFVKRQYKRDVIKRVIHPELYEIHIEELKPL